MAISIGLNSAMRALLAQQTAMDVVGHNVANVNTPGYSRQRVVLTPVAPPGGAGIGGGVSVEGIQRIRDVFVDFQIRAQSQSGSEYKARADSLNLVQIAVNEPSDSGLRSVMDAFFNSWRDLANAPEDGAARSAVVQSGQTFAVTANRIVRSLGSLRDSADARVQNSVTEVNNLASQIASLNGQIINIRGGGDPASDLTDRRDAALDRLSQLVDMNYVEQPNGRVDVFVGGRALVNGVTTTAITGVRNPANNNYVDLQWATDGAAVNVTSGEIGGLLHQRDTDLPGRIADLNALVGQVITDVNTAHAAGFALDGVTTGTPFFAGTDATDIVVDPAIVTSPSLLAAATATGAVGDGSNAFVIAGLQSATNLTGNSQSYGAFYNSFIARLGIASQDAQGLADAQDLTVNHLEQLRQGTSGVNLDEEMVNMVQFQRGYESAARLIRTIDEMLDTLINRT